HRKLVCQRYGHRHQLRILITRIPKHHSLVAGAASVHAHGDVAGLLVDAGDNGAGVGVESVEGVVVPDRSDGATDQSLQLDIRLGGNFSGDNHQSGGGQGFASHAAGRIFGQAGVEDGARTLVGNFIVIVF